MATHSGSDPSERFGPAAEGDPVDPAPVLEAQRATTTHDGPGGDRPDDGIAPIINNTGDDGGPASG